MACATVEYYGTGALNFDEFESTDSIIIDLLAADVGTGTFYAEVFAATGVDTGSYELFGYKSSAIPEPTSFVMFGVAICLLELVRAGTINFGDSVDLLDGSHSCRF